MDKLEFMFLDLEKQVDYYNQQLKQGQTLEEIAQKLDIDETYLIKRFKKWGYFYDSDTKQYKQESMSDKFSWSKGDLQVIMPNKQSIVEKE